MPIVALPGEIFPSILASLEQKYRASLTLSCRQIRNCTYPTLYADVTLRDGQGQASKFLTTLTEQPTFAKHIRTIAFEYTDEYADGHAADILPLVSNLAHLKIKSPYDNNDEISEWPVSDDITSRARLRNLFTSSALTGTPISQLKTCSLEYRHGFCDWDTGGLGALLFHPTLQAYRAVHGVGFSDPERVVLIDKMKKKHFTDLQTLQLIACDIERDELFQLLSIPRALKRFEFVYTK